MQFLNILGLLCLLMTSEIALALRPREKAPRFSLMAAEGEKFRKISSDDYLGEWLVLFFYPFDFTFVCPTEITAFSDNIDKFKELRANVLGCSTDSHHTHLAWLRTKRTEGGLGKISFPLLADISKDVSKSYGVLVEDEHDEMYGAALRGMFIIDPKGVIRSLTINDDAVGRSVNEALRLLQAFQHADSHQGEVCPAGWQPGDDTLKADQHKKFEYFAGKGK